jgi:hypothetical protein
MPMTARKSRKPTKKAKLTAIGIQSGDNTHNQDHVMVPVNFRPIKRIARRLPKDNPPPPTDTTTFLDMIYSKY